MFGYVKKETIINIIEEEVEMNRRTFDKYRRMADTHAKHRHEDECSERETVRCSELADEYFARYLECKEILTQLRAL